ncbi:MAG: hypothetical protein ACPG05_05220 [Bdellovibrionales bacterium]
MAVQRNFIAPEYTVYSYDFAQSEKKGQVWRQHGVSDNLEEAYWIAEQLKVCANIERIEIRLQGIDAKTKRPKDRVVKVLDKSKDGKIKTFFDRWLARSD